MKLTYTDLNNCLEAVRTAYGNDKAGQSNIILINDTANQLMMIAGVSSTYQVAKLIRPEYDERDVDVQILVNLKGLLELVSMTRPGNGIETSIELLFDTERKEIIFGIIKYIKQGDELRKLSNIKHRLGFTYVMESKRSGLDELNYGEMFSILSPEFIKSESAVYNKQDILQTLQKLSSGDAAQIIMSTSTGMAATANTNYVVCQSKESLISATIMTSVAKNIMTVIRTCFGDEIAFIRDEKKLYVIDMNNTTCVRTEIPLARRLVLTQIDNFNQADYSLYGAVIQRNALLDLLKCFSTITNSATTSFQMRHTGEENDWTLEISQPGSKSKMNTFEIQIDSMTGNVNAFNKTFDLSISVLTQMLNTCNTNQVKISLTEPNTDAETEIQYLVQISSIDDEGNSDIICYTVLEANNNDNE